MSLHCCNLYGMRDELPVVSLFSGAGGLDLGVEMAGEPPLDQDGSPGPYRIALATDHEAAALRTLQANVPGVATACGDIRLLSSQELMERAGLRPGDPALVVGGPPCTPFSKSGFWLAEKRESRDPNASLLDEFVRVVRDLQPAGFVLENVQALTYGTHEAQFARLLQGFAESGYSVGWKVLIAADYGVPQLRRRVFVLGRRDGGPITFPLPTHSGWSERDRSVDPRLKPYVSSRQAIGDLLPGDAEPDEIVDGRWGELAAEIPPGKNYLWHTNRGGGRNEWKWRSRYWTFLLRLDPNRPATTIQAQPGPWVGPFHWKNVETDSGPRVRRLRTPELLRLFTYPTWYLADDDRRRAQVQIGNSVPVELGKAVVRHLAELLGHLEPSQHRYSQSSLLDVA